MPEGWVEVGSVVLTSYDCFGDSTSETCDYLKVYNKGDKYYGEVFRVYPFNASEQIQIKEITDNVDFQDVYSTI